MYSSRFWLYLSLALAALFSFSNATFGFERRQADDGLTDISAVPSDIESAPAAAASTTLPVINADTSTTSSDTSTSTSIPSSDAGTTTGSNIIIPPISISNSTSTTSTPSSTPTIPSSTPSAPSSTSSNTEFSVFITTPSVTSIPRSTVVVTVTSDGSTFTSSSVSYQATTAIATLAASSDSSTEGPPGGTKSVIIGVTVGIGGAIILAGLGFVAWRLWGRRAPRMDEDEILMAGSNAHGEKLTGGSGHQFKSTLDQYHAHSGTNF